MGGEDKGLLELNGRPLVAYALDALKQAAGTLLINANRNRELYERFGFPVIADRTDHFDGPLAGLLSAMEAAKTDYVLTMPCDCPLMTGELLSRLYDRVREEDAEICAAHDGERLHPVFVIARRSLAPDLAEYLKSGQRKLETWLKSRSLAITDYSGHPEAFVNINTPQELKALQIRPRSAGG